MKNNKTAEEIIQIIQKEEQQILKTIKKIRDEERKTGKNYPASIERLTAEMVMCILIFAPINPGHL